MLRLNVRAAGPLEQEVMTQKEVVVLIRERFAVR